MRQIDIECELTTSRTASIRYHDGSFEDIVKVEGDAEYTSTIRSFVEQKNIENGEDSITLANTFFDEIKRRLNRLLGRPSTLEIGIIAKLLSEIKRKVHEQTGLSVAEAVIAMPNLFEADNIRRQQFQLDLDEASNYAGIKPLMPRDWVSAASAGAASQSWGLCSSYTDLLACEAEEENMAVETVLTVEYTRDALIVAMFTVKTASSVSDKLTRIWYDDGADHDKDDGYWAMVKERIQELPLNVYKKSPTRILATGVAADSSEFLEVLREAVEELHMGKPYDEAVANGYDPLFAVARGAAEFAKRKQEAPRNCIEPQKCQDIRRKLKEEYRKGDEKHVDVDHQELR